MGVILGVGAVCERARAQGLAREGTGCAGGATRRVGPYRTEGWHTTVFAILRTSAFE